MQKLTREQIQAIYDSGSEAVIKLVEKLYAEIDELTQQLSGAKVRVQELENQIAKDSHNSHKPPSSDGPKKKACLPRNPGSRKAGGQKGHKGHTLERVSEPDHKIICPVNTCKKCKRSLTMTPAQTYESRQVFDLPPDIRIEVTEFQAEIKDCEHCGTTNQADFPDGVTHPTQYGSRIKSRAAYLMNQHLIPYERTCEIIFDFYDHKLSAGTLSNVNQACYKALEEPVEKIKEQIIASEVVNFDETGLRAEGKGQWLHTASTPELTFYDIHQKRGKEAMNDINILPKFKGTAVHDHWKSYFTYDCDHALCNSHHLRDLIYIFEQYQQNWAQEMIDLLLEIKEAVDQAKITGAVQLDQNIIAAFEHRYREILDEGFRMNPDFDPKRKRKKKTEPQRLLHRLRAFQKETLTFMYDFQVPFDNNLAERDIRMMKVRQKISGCFRKQKGAKTFCRIRSYISTAKKQGGNILQALQSVFDGQPMIPVDIPE